ncbi:hypothetical protein AB4099_27285 [Bosea sp. 2KB_26]|uniref:hypothetical protein n=2 Tax=Pseudomonadota TaxID=1224 RepID=UPI003F8FB88A
MKEPTDEERARLSGSVMRVFVNIAKRWDLPERRQLQLLGCRQREFHRWVRLSRWHKPLVLETDTMMRISAILGVFGDLRQFLRTAEEERRWLLRPIEAEPFAGQAPMELLCVSFERQMEVRQCLSGVVRHIAPNEADENFRPYTVDDIKWH